MQLVFFIYICAIITKYENTMASKKTIIVEHHSASLSLYLEDNMAFMKKTPDKHFQLSIADPAYGIGASSGTNQQAKAKFLKERKTWDNERPTPEYISEVFRVSEKCIFFGANHYADLLPPTKDFFIWDKCQYGRIFSECELAFCYGFDGAGITNGRVFRLDTSTQKYKKLGEKIHPTQKPTDLYKWILTHYAKEGYKIFDPNLGSGTSARAAHDYDFNFVGVDNDSDYFKRMLKHLHYHTTQNKIQW